MLIFSLIFVLLSNSITPRRDKSTLYSRIGIGILLISSFITYNNLFILFLAKLIGIFVGLFHIIIITYSGTTNLDSLYIITSISNASKDNLTGLLYWYKPYYIHVSLLFMGVGFLFKVSAAPFHFWSPDVYDAIPTVVTTFVAIIAKISIFIFLLELVHYIGKYIFDIDFFWTTGLLFSSLLSLIVGTVAGLTQSRIKRLFAFSTISHVGFILLGLSIHIVESIQAFIFYLIQYFISIITMVIALFIFIPEELLRFANILALLLFNL